MIVDPWPRASNPATAESENHELASKAVKEERFAILKADVPKWLPAAVITVDPVLGRLPGRATLTPGLKYETALDLLPESAPDVKATRIEAVTPALPLHRTEESEIHVVASHAVENSRDRDE